MMTLLSEMFNYPFMQRAFLAGTLITLCASLLGVTLVLKRFSMIGDGLSHVGFGAMALATVLNASPMAVSLPIVMAASILLLFMSRSQRLNGDSALALVSTGSMAIGVMLISMTEGMNVDVYNYLFGSILSMSSGDVKLSIALSLVVLVLFLLFYRRIFAVTFDENFAQATGTKTWIYNVAISLFTAVVIVLGMRMMGSLLISSLIVFPALTAMRLFKTFRSVMTVSAIISVICLWLGLTTSYLFATPAGASIVLYNIGAFLVFYIIGRVRE